MMVYENDCKNYRLATMFSEHFLWYTSRVFSFHQNYEKKKLYMFKKNFSGYRNNIEINNKLIFFITIYKIFHNILNGLNIM